MLLYTIAYFVIPKSVGASVENLFVADAFFIAANIICVIGLYSMNRLERTHFLRQKQLFDNQTEIRRINADLEEKVLTRTKDLKLAKEKDEGSERLTTAFLANMSHEIRPPMNGILGFSDLLKNPKLSGEEQQRFLPIIEKSGSRMLSTVNDIVEISKNETGIELVLMDIKISVMNGLITTRLIKEMRPNLPIIATTANAYPKDWFEVDEAGCDGFITKPINKTELFALLDENLLKKAQ